MPARRVRIPASGEYVDVDIDTGTVLRSVATAGPSRVAAGPVYGRRAVNVSDGRIIGSPVAAEGPIRRMRCPTSGQYVDQLPNGNATYGRELENAAIQAARRNGGSLFYVPRTLSGAWLNTDGTGAPAVGSTVGRLDDVASGRNATQGTAGARPTIALLANGQAALTFDGGDALYLPGPAVVPIAETFVWSGTIATTGAARYLVSRRAGASGGAFIRQSTGDALEVGGLNNVLALTSTSGGALVVENPFTAEGVVRTGLLRAWLDGTQVASTTSPTISHAAATVGASIGSQAAADINGGHSGTTRLAFWAPSELSDTDRRAIARFGAWLAGASYTA